MVMRFYPKGIKAQFIRLGIILFLNTLSLLFSLAYASNRSPVILSTIQPVHLLVKEILTGVGRAELLIPANSDLHDYQLRPSALRKIIKADLVVRVSPQLEPFLDPLITGKRSINLQALKSIQWLVLRHDHHHHHDHDDHDDHDDHAEDEGKVLFNDPHLWLNPKNAIQITVEINRWIVTNYPQLAELSNANSAKLIAKIERIDQETKQQLTGLQQHKYMILHDATQYFQAHYGLEAPHVLSLQDAVRPGIKSYQKAREVIKASHVACIVVNKNKPSTALRTITKDLLIPFVAVDINGTTMTSYPELLQQFGRKMISCLSGKGG